MPVVMLDRWVIAAAQSSQTLRLRLMLRV